MTSPISPASPVPIEELRRRVKEAEALLGVARGLARDELNDPGSCERARDRIISILKEIDALFPGMGDPPSPVDPAELVAPSMREQFATAGTTIPAPPPVHDADDAADGAHSHGVDDTDLADEEADDGDDDEADDEEVEWEIDRKKLAAAIENEQLMSKIPEVDREWFKGMARRTIEAQERVELCERVRMAFDELSRSMRQGLDETSRQLSVALTFEQLKNKRQQ